MRIVSFVQRVEDLADSFVDVLDAFDLLADDVPLAAMFPDGSRRPDVPTPRQLIYLADLAAIPRLDRDARSSGREG
jgi:hypothetical protein